MSNALIEAYKPRILDGNHPCCICGKVGKPMSFHALEYSQYDYLPHPIYFIPMSGSGGRLRGSFPICTSCAKPCKKCGLAIKSEKFEEKYIELSNEYEGVRPGNGTCDHFHFSLLMHAIYKRIFKIGRFGKN